MSFLAPLFLAGATLIAVPFIIHQIRRPEREVVKFSSLMFVPKVEKEVIERRKIQHLLLMLLRMFLFVLLVAAFARPYWRALAAGVDPEAAARHVILVDTSYSMGTLNWFREAKDQAKALVDGLPAEDQVAVIGFDAQPFVEAPLRGEDTSSGSKRAALAAIDRLELSYEVTDYVSALRRAQEVLLGGESTEDDPAFPRIVHLFSDFQRAGMPGRAAAWKLNQRITLEGYPVGSATAPNQTVADLAVRQSQPDRVRVQAKIKNWTVDSANPTTVKLFLDGEEAESKSVAVRKKNASSANFQAQLKRNTALSGWIEVGRDALAVDNRRYFVWNLPEKQRALLVADAWGDRQWPASWFVTLALPKDADQPWDLERVEQNQLAGLLESSAPPEAILAADLNSVSGAAAAALIEYVRAGGALILALNETMDAESLNAQLLPALGLRAEGLLFPEARPSQYAVTTWVDLDHPIFELFRGASYNDFSQLRIYNMHVLEPTPDGQDPETRVIAQTDADGDGRERAVMIESTLGKGTAIVWPAGMELKWSTFAKDNRFVPILYETLAYLAGHDQDRRQWTVGGTVPLPDPGRPLPVRWTAEIPTREGPDTVDIRHEKSSQTIDAAMPGFVRWTSPDDPDFSRIEAVNVDPRESDPDRIDLAEFQLKLCASPQIVPKDGAGPAAAETRSDELKYEFGLIPIALLLLLMTFESWYATRLSR